MSETQPPRIVEPGVSRRRLLQQAALTGAIVAPLGALAAFSRRGPSTAAAAAAPAVAPAAAPAHRLVSSDQNATYFMEIMNDENAHVTFLQNALKTAARPKPSFKGLEQGDVNAFIKLSSVFENTGVGAYLLAAPSISNKDYLAAAGSILTIEARHAGYLDSLLSTPLSPNGAFDKPIQQADIVSAVSPFIAGLNGGSDPAGKLGNDTDILNFALLLEFLEAEYYNVNVPKFYGVTGKG